MRKLCLAAAAAAATVSAGPALAQNDMGGGQHTMPMGDKAAGSGQEMHSGKMRARTRSFSRA